MTTLGAITLLAIIAVPVCIFGTVLALHILGNRKENNND